MAELFRSTSTCTTCGGPSPGYNRVILCRQVGDEVIPVKPRCPECDLAVDDHGRATAAAARMPRNTEVFVRRIIPADDVES